MTNLSRNVGVSRNQLIKLFDLLCEGAILRAFRENIVRPGDLSKPVKILFDNPSLLQAVGSDIRIGTVRETFAAAMLGAAGSVTCPKQCDFFVDGKYTFEVGGKHKNFAQIADLPESFVLSDDIETGFGNKIPLWLLGFLY